MRMTFVPRFCACADLGPRKVLQHICACVGFPCMCEDGARLEIPTFCFSVHALKSTLLCVRRCAAVLCQDPKASQCFPGQSLELLQVRRCATGLCQDPKTGQSPSTHLYMCQTEKDGVELEAKGDWSFRDEIVIGAVLMTSDTVSQIVIWYYYAHLESLAISNTTLNWFGCWRLLSMIVNWESESRQGNQREFLAQLTD